MPGSLQWRARNILLGSVLGAAIGFPLGNTFNHVNCLLYIFRSYAANKTHFVAGWAHLKLVEIANEGNPAAHPNSDQIEAKSGVGAAIERLEENLNK